MKVIVIGAEVCNEIGDEVFEQVLDHPDITDVTYFKRMPQEFEAGIVVAASKKHSHSIIGHDFAAWPAPILEYLEGSEACIW
jgi:hypothetical protein